MKTKYIIIMPVYNEVKFIGKAIESVIAQTILPQKWVIVDDSSSDGTTEIIKQYEAKYDFIIYHRFQRSNTEHYYYHKTKTFKAGYEKVKNVKYDFIASLDADITLEPMYYEGLLGEFDRNSKLGVAAGTYIYEVNGHFQEVPIDKLCTPGSNNIFRRECYEQIGGYTPLKYGGEDSLTDILARMHGWETRSFLKYQVIQHRVVGTRSEKTILRARFHQGLAEYGIATHPIFMVLKSLRRIVLEKPYLIGSLARLAGFLYGYWLREEREIPLAVERFARHEQIKRLFSYLTKR